MVSRCTPLTRKVIPSSGNRYLSTRNMFHPCMCDQDVRQNRKLVGPRRLVPARALPLLQRKQPPPYESVWTLFLTWSNLHSSCLVVGFSEQTRSSKRRFPPRFRDCLTSSTFTHVPSGDDILRERKTGMVKIFSVIFRLRPS